MISSPYFVVNFVVNDFVAERKALFRQIGISIKGFSSV